MLLKVNEFITTGILLDFIIIYVLLNLIITFCYKELTEKGLIYIYSIFLFIFLYVLIYKHEAFMLANTNTSFSLNIFDRAYKGINFSLNFKIDSLTFFFIFLVVFIGFFANLFTLHYFKYEAQTDLFLVKLHWFIISMLLFVTADDLITLYFGWESVGLSSFFLINFWTLKKSTLKSSLKAFTFNKISDTFLLLFIVYMYIKFNTINITTINTQIDNLKIINDSYLKTAALLLILCSSLKSAQILGHLWLPDSMEAPVPASALIHSATLVSAGVYLLIRFNSLLNITNSLNILIYLGSVTAALGGVISAAQTDLKKLLAYSTISHCGFLFVCIGIKAHLVLIIYLYLHGIFKALTFMIVGSIIRSTNTQDDRQIGILSKTNIYESTLLMISSFNLGGLPFTMGFLYKKLFIVALAKSVNTSICIGFLYIGMLSSLVYTIKLNYYVSFDINKRVNIHPIYFIQNKNKNLTSKFTTTTNIFKIITIVMYISSIFIYITLKHYYIGSNIVFDLNPIYIHYDVVIENLTEKKYNLYLRLFYFLYFTILIIINVYINRSEATFIYKLEIMIQLYFQIVIIILVGTFG